MGLSTGMHRDLSLLEASSQAPGSEAQASCHPALGKTHCTPKTVIHTAQSCLGQEVESLTLRARSPDMAVGGAAAGLPQGSQGASPEAGLFSREKMEGFLSVLDGCR